MVCEAASQMKLLTVDQVMGAPAAEYVQFSAGTRAGLPWRRDSVYVTLADFELLSPPFHAALRWFHAQGVTHLQADEAQLLAAALEGHVEGVRQLDVPVLAWRTRHPALDARAVHRAWQTVREDLADLALTLGAWLRAQSTHGLVIERL